MVRDEPKPGALFPTVSCHFHIEQWIRLSTHVQPNAAALVSRATGARSADRRYAEAALNGTGVWLKLLYSATMLRLSAPTARKRDPNAHTKAEITRLGMLSHSKTRLFVWSVLWPKVVKAYRA
jgi:hypothetical protein